MGRIEAVTDLLATVLEGAKLLRPNPERLRRRARRKFGKAARLQDRATLVSKGRKRKLRLRAVALRIQAVRLRRDADKLAAGT